MRSESFPRRHEYQQPARDRHPKAARSLRVTLVVLVLVTTVVTLTRSITLLEQGDYTPRVIVTSAERVRDLGEETLKPSPKSTPAPTTQAPKLILPPVSRLSYGNAPIHNAAFIKRSSNFDESVSRQRGVVMSIHKGVFALGLCLIGELRCLGNDELIQIYHCFPAELPDNLQQVLLDQDNRLEIVDACSDLVNASVSTESGALNFRNWWLKPLVLHHTDLQEVILLDADDILLQNPALVRLSKG
ncbi:hypothetical protein Poli38472_008815 [Pythium oligandrum]|uniref:Hexosyltransferase n=1 Tax=Pythium oligandrum TaxID=41045 RepID=A0A8K1C466_PYTOL|nr:hypothetical protein Poli38472_008815 [Pythium oligandrum]|eukprot:TMW56167.1 hypothetical protein Poli38472_008815 [Pythium oligandrum]